MSVEKVKQLKFKDYLEGLNDLAKYHPHVLEYGVVANVDAIVEKYEPVDNVFGVPAKQDEFGNVKFLNDKGDVLSTFECNVVVVN